MKSNYVAGIVILLAIVMCCVISCNDDNKRQKVELSEYISKVRQDNGKYNLVNTETGKTLIRDVDVEWIQTGHDSLAVFSKNDKRGYFNVNTGEIVIEPTYKHAWIFSEGLAGVVKNDKVGFINAKGEVVIDFQFPYRGNSLSDFVFHDGRCVVADSGQKLGVIDTLGNWILLPKYDEISLSGDYVVVGIEGEFCQQIGYDGRVILDCVIDNVCDIYYNVNYTDLESGRPCKERVSNSEFYEYRVGTRSGLMNNRGEFITKPIYTSVYGLGPHLFRAILQDGCSEVLIDEHGRVLSKVR